MKRLIVASIAALGLANSFSSATLGIAHGSEPMAPPTLVTVDEMSQAGLRRAWDSHVQLDASHGRLVEMQLVVDTKRTTTKYVVQYGGLPVTQEVEVVVDGVVETVTESRIIGAQREVFSELDLGPRGTPYGIDGAKAAADLRVEILAAEGKTAEVIEEVNPRITFFALTDQYVLQAFDGESGQSLWSTRVGPRGSFPLPFAATSDHVVVVNGMQIFCLDALTGTELWNRKASHAPGSGPAITSWFVYLPMLRGQVEVFPLHRGDGLPEPIVFGGRVMQAPVLVGNEVAWINNQNTLFIAPVGAKVNRDEFRVRFDEPISTQIGTDGDRAIYCGTAEGALYSISANQGALLWKQSLSYALRQTPSCIGSDVFVVTIDGSLHVLRDATGIARWRAPHIKQFVSATDKHVYALNTTGQLEVLNRATGLREAEIDVPPDTFALPNVQTDRLYLATPQGRLICLHESESPKSVLHSGEVLEPNRGEESDDTVVPVRPTRPEVPAAPTRDPDDVFGFGR